MLEDDSQLVRLAGIQSMSHFAKQTPQIRQKVLRFLIDMLNDEIDDVRIGSLLGIASFNQVMQLNKDEVDTVLFNLTEDNCKLRRGIYTFFGEIIIEEVGLLKQLVNRILQNLYKYLRQDQAHVFTLMQ